MFVISIFCLEKIIERIKDINKIQKNINHFSVIGLIIISILLIISVIRLGGLNINTSININSITLPSIKSLLIAINNIDLVKLISQTLFISLLATGIAVGIPPIMSMLFPTSIGQDVIAKIYMICRTLPSPLIALLLLLFIYPSLSVASLAIGIQNMGVLGRILKENIDRNDKFIAIAFEKSGASKSSSWLYGKFCQQSNSYLVYSLYRFDIILKETAAIGVVGGSGLGWKLQESLSSFAWEEVLIIVATFISLTMIGESLSGSLEASLNNKKMQSFNPTPNVSN